MKRMKDPLHSPFSLPFPSLLSLLGRVGCRWPRPRQGRVRMVFAFRQVSCPFSGEMRMSVGHNAEGVADFKTLLFFPLLHSSSSLSLGLACLPVGPWREPE